MALLKPYDHSTYPQNGALGSSQALRNELDAIETGFDTLDAALDAAMTGANGAATVAIAQAVISTTQAGISTTQAGISTAQAGVATTKASEAAASANSAATILTTVNNVYDSFDDRYLGAKAFDPTLDNDGNALVAGALYLSTTTLTFRGYSGTAWIALPSSLASGIAFTPDGNLSPSATNVQAALIELDADLSVLNANLNSLDSDFNAHISDAVDAHDAAAISYVPSTGVTKTNVQEAIAEIGIREGVAYAVTSGTSLDYIANPLVPITEYVDGKVVLLKFDKDCATNARIKFSGLNPPPDLKIPNALGLPVNVFAGDIKAGYSTFGIFIDGGTGCLVEPAVNAVTQVGFIEKFPANTVPFGYLACPLAPTNISRTVYAELFAQLGTNWGTGDGSTTFGMPWFPSDYTDVQANGNVGTSTVGSNLSHTHTQNAHNHIQDAHAHGMPNQGGVSANSTGVGSGTFNGASTTYTTDNTTATNQAATATNQSSGGSANLPAGVRIQFCVRYRD